MRHHKLCWLKRPFVLWIHFSCQFSVQPLALIRYSPIPFTQKIPLHFTHTIYVHLFWMFYASFTLHHHWHSHLIFDVNKHRPGEKAECVGDTKYLRLIAEELTQERVKKHEEFIFWWNLNASCAFMHLPRHIRQTDSSFIYRYLFSKYIKYSNKGKQ